MQYPYGDIFSTAQKSFWTHKFWCLVLLLFFVSPLPHSQNISLWGLFSSWEIKKKVAWGEIVRIGRVDHRGHADFGWKFSVVWADTLVNHPSWNGQVHCKSLQKKFTEAKPDPHNTASWYTDTDGFLGHSHCGRKPVYYKKPALQKIILGFSGPHSYKGKVTHHRHKHSLIWKNS